MRRLILMRHAKSSWDDPGQRDLDRPLNKRGRQGAGAIGEWLRERATGREHGARLDGAADAGDLGRGRRRGRPAETTYLPELYHASPRQLFAVLRQAPDVATVLMLGHQPGIGGFARRLLASQPGRCATLPSIRPGRRR